MELQYLLGLSKILSAIMHKLSSLILKKFNETFKIVLSKYALLHTRI